MKAAITLTESDLKTMITAMLSAKGITVKSIRFNYDPGYHDPREQKSASTTAVVEYDIGDGSGVLSHHWLLK